MGQRGVAYHLDAVARAEVDGFVEHGGAHFGSLGVHQDGDAVGYGAHVADDFVQAGLVQVGGVQPHDVHARFE